MFQHEITGEGPLLDEKGYIRESGWARHPLLAYERAAVAVPARRIKEWDSYYIFSRYYGVILSIADNGFTGYISATVIDFAEGTQRSESFSSLFPLGGFGLPPSSVKGDSKVRIKKGYIDFSVMDKGVRIVRVDFPAFDQGRGLRGALVLTPQEDAESLVKVTPWKGKPRAFYYNRKINCLAAEGVIIYGGKELMFARDESFATMNWGRGSWPRTGDWRWGAASWVHEGKPFGFTIGYGYGDNAAASENALYYDGKIHKLGTVTFHINHRDTLAPWRFTSDDGRLEMGLDPRLNRSATLRGLFLTTVQSQVFGEFSGRAKLDDGTVIHFDRIPGFAEKVKNRW